MSNPAILFYLTEISAIDDDNTFLINTSGNIGNTAITRRLSCIPESDDYSVDKDPQPTPSLSLAGTTSLYLNDLTLHVASATETKAIDLHSKTVAQIAAEMPVSIVATVIADGIAELLLLEDGEMTLNIATSPLWIILATLSRNVESRRRALLSDVKQINLRAARSIWLDWWGASLGIGRLKNEPDILYIQRVIDITLEPIVNNVAIERLFENLGYDVSVIDGQPGSFSMSINTYPTSPPDGFMYSNDQILQILERVKAGGIVAIIETDFTISDSAALTETLTTTVPTGEFVWDVSRWGLPAWT